MGEIVAIALLCIVVAIEWWLDYKEIRRALAEARAVRKDPDGLSGSGNAKDDPRTDDEFDF